MDREPYDDARPGDRMVTVGAGIFAVGLLAAMVTLVPLVLDVEPLPTEVYALTALLPLGLGVALLGMLRGSRARRGVDVPR